MDNAEAVVRAALICLLFFLLHSLLMAERVKTLALGVLGSRLMGGWYRLFYTCLSVSCLIAAICLASISPIRSR
jgi:hypothetical protein